MALTSTEREQTAAELRANLELSGLTDAELEHRTGWTRQRLHSTITISRADPVDVWTLRDLLEAAVLEAGRTPFPYTVLTDSARARAADWFGIPR